MVKTCCAPNCRNKSKKPGTSFFCFPKAPQLRREWVRRVNKTNFQPTRHTVLCSNHFVADCFLNESVPEFLQLIGLEQRPARRRLRSGAVPTLFKRTANGWEEGRGDEEEMGTEQGGEEDAVSAKEEGEWAEEDSEEEGKFLIQMDVAEEDTVEPETVVATDSQVFSQHQSQKRGDNQPVTPRSQVDGQGDNKIEDKSSSRPRRSCRLREKDEEVLKQEHQEGLESEDEQNKRSAFEKQDLGVELECHTAEEDDNDDSDTEDYEPSEEGSRMFTIESVRTLSGNKEPVDDAGDKGGAGGSVRLGISASHSPRPDHSSSSAPKKRKSSKKNSEKQLSLVGNSLPRPPGPILCRIDPAFCKYETVFEVPFASSPGFFSRTADSLVVDKADKKLNSGMAGQGISLQSNRQDAPRSTSDDVGSRSTRMIMPPRSESPSPVTSPTCTLPCCTGKPSSSGASYGKVLHIKQELMDTSCSPPSDLPTEPSHLPHPHELRRRKAPAARLSPGEIPYRSSPVNFTEGKTSGVPYRSDPVKPPRGTEATKGTVPYRSEPLKKLPKAMPVLHKVKRNLTNELGWTKVCQTPLGTAPHGRGDPAPGGKGDRGKAGGGGPPLGLARLLSAAKSPPASLPAASKKKSSTAVEKPQSSTVTSSHNAPVILSIPAQEAALAVTPALSDHGPLFIRRDHVLADLLDIFKHSGDKVHRATVFRLCHNVSGNTAAAIPLALPVKGEQLQQDNWEDVEHKRLFSLFWEECLKVHFDGHQHKVPKSDCQSGTSDIPYILGKILRHGFVLCGYWPVALSSACAVTVFTGEKCSASLFLLSLRRTMFPYEAQALDDLQESAREGGLRFQEVRLERRVSLMVETYGGAQCQVPAVPEEMEAFVVELAAYYLYCQPFWWLREMRRGFLSVTEHTRHDQNYLTSMTEREVVEMYHTLEPSPHALLRRTVFRIEEGKQVTHNRLKAFLERCLLRLSYQQLLRLLKRWSHADCLLDDTYHVKFSSATTGTWSGAPPLFRASHNTLVLGTTTPTFEIFEAFFRDLLEEKACGD